MRSTRLAVLCLLLLAPGALAAPEAPRWPVSAAGLMAADAFSVAPPDFKRIVARHGKRLMEGVKAGLAASPVRDDAARRAALAKGARQVAQAIRDHKRFEDVAYEAGGLVAEASLLFPPKGAPSDDAALAALARQGSSFLGYPAKPFEAPEALVAAKLPPGTAREAYDSGLTLSARLLAWIWKTAGGDASVASAMPESKGPYQVR